MSKRLAEIEGELKNSNITKDAYELWKENSVTRRFFLEMEQNLIKVQEDTTPAGRDSIEKIALSCVKNAEHCETLEMVLEWKPDELESDD